MVTLYCPCWNRGSAEGSTTSRHSSESQQVLVTGGRNRQSMEEDGSWDEYGNQDMAMATEGSFTAAGTSGRSNLVAAIIIHITKFAHP